MSALHKDDMAVQTAVKRLKFAKLNPSATAEKITEMTGGVEFKLSNHALHGGLVCRGHLQRRTLSPR